MTDTSPFWSAAPVSPYSHAPYSRPADRPPLSFMGHPEVEFRNAWTSTWQQTATTLNDPAFTDTTHPMAMIAVLDSALHDAAFSMITRVGPVIAAQLVLGAAAEQAPIPATKARTARPGIFSRVLQGGPLPLDPRSSQPITPPSPSNRYLVAAQKLTLNMVQDITREQRVRLQQFIIKAFETNQSPRDIAASISSIVGLNDRWSRAVYRLRSSMLKNGISPSIAGKRAYDYAQELLAKRGAMIARTEMVRAFNAGRYESWLERDASGSVDGQLVRKQWITAPGACLECVMTSDPHSTGIPKVVVGLFTPFQSPYGPILYPPLHPHCRCNVNYLPGSSISVLRGG